MLICWLNLAVMCGLIMCWFSPQKKKKTAFPHDFKTWHYRGPVWRLPRVMWLSSLFFQWTFTQDNWLLVTIQSGEVHRFPEYSAGEPSNLLCLQALILRSTFADFSNRSFKNPVWRSVLNGIRAALISRFAGILYLSHFRSRDIQDAFRYLSTMKHLRACTQNYWYKLSDILCGQQLTLDC